MSSSFSSSSSSTVVPSGDSPMDRKGKLPEMSCDSPYGEWTSSEIKLIFRDVKPDPKPSMIMLQMIADAYEERHRVWEFNKDQLRQKVNNPAMYGPINKAQKKVEDSLVEWRFISGPSVLDKEALIMDKPVTPKAVAQELIIPSSEDRSPRTRKPLSASMKIRYVLHDLNIGKMSQAPSLPKKSKRKAAPVDLTPRLRPVLPTLPRYNPGYEVKQLKEKTLRRMTWADSHALCTSSVRKRKFTPVHEYIPTAEFLAEMHPPPRRLIPTREPRIQHDDFKLLFPMQPQDQRLKFSEISISKTNITFVDHKKSCIFPFISLAIYLLIQFIILALCVVGVFVALWILSCIIVRCFQKCIFFVPSLPQSLEEDADL